jgi:uncharacterized protein (DUF1697 family)
LALTLWAALFRGINVGGNNKLPMAELRVLAAELGLDKPRTYIQSGNLVFASDKDAVVLETMLAAAIKQRFGFAPSIIMRTADDIKHALALNPFASRVTEGKQLHLFFLDAAADRYDEEKLRALATVSEDFVLIGDVFYLFAPDGIGRSRLAEKMGPYFPKRMTARNLNSINAIMAMMEG